MSLRPQGRRGTVPARGPYRPRLLLPASTVGLLLALVAVLLAPTGGVSVGVEGPPPHVPSSARLVASSPGPSGRSLPPPNWTLVGSVAVGTAPFGVASAAGFSDVYVANSASNNLSLIVASSLTVQANVAAGPDPWALALDTTSGDVYVADVGSDLVTVLSSGGAPVARIGVGGGPDGAVYDAAQDQVFVANSVTDNVSIISGASNAVVANVAVGTAPGGLAYDSGLGEVFVANTGSQNVSVISATSDTVVANVRVGTDPTGAAYDSGASEVFVSNLVTSNVSVLADSSNSVVATVHVGQDPEGVAYVPAQNEVLVANQASDNVSVISDTDDRVVDNLAAGAGPSGLALDAAQGEVFVADFDGNAAAVLAPVQVASTTISPSPVTLTVFRSLALTATATDEAGHPVSGAQFSWGLSPSSLGSLSSLTGATTTLTASSSNGTGHVCENASYEASRVQGCAPVAVLSPLLANVTLSSYDVEAGTPVVASARAWNGAGVAFSWTLNGTVPLGSCSGPTCDLTLNHGASYEVNVTATDDVGRHAGAQAPLRVSFLAPLSVALASNTSSIHAGGSVVLTATPSGGVSPYSYLWALNGTNTSQTGASWTPTLLHPGNYTYRVWVADAEPRTAESGAVKVEVLRVPPPPPVFEALLTVNQTTFHAGGKVVFSAEGVDGPAPYSYAWSLNGTNASSLGTANGFALQFYYPGNYTFRVWVTDAVGATVGSSPVVIEVLPSIPSPPTPAPHSWLTTTNLLLLVIVVVALVALLLAFAIRRSKAAAARAKKAGFFDELAAYTAPTPGGQSWLSPGPTKSPSRSSRAAKAAKEPPTKPSPPKTGEGPEPAQSPEPSEEEAP